MDLIEEDKEMEKLALSIHSSVKKKDQEDNKSLSVESFDSSSSSNHKNVEAMDKSPNIKFLK